MRVLRSFAVAFAAFCMSASPASARDIRVALDQAFPIRLSEAAEGVAVGNPTIAGVSVQNDTFLFVTGRVLYSGRIVVTPDETDVVMVTRGVDTARLECTPLCRPRPDIGDGQDSQNVNEQITSRAAAAAAGRR